MANYDIPNTYLSLLPYDLHNLISIYLKNIKLSNLQVLMDILVKYFNNVYPSDAERIIYYINDLLIHDNLSLRITAKTHSWCGTIYNYIIGNKNIALQVENPQHIPNSTFVDILKYLSNWFNNVYVNSLLHDCQRDFRFIRDYGDELIEICPTAIYNDLVKGNVRFWNCVKVGDIDAILRWWYYDIKLSKTMTIDEKAKLLLSVLADRYVERMDLYNKILKTHGSNIRIIKLPHTFEIVLMQ